MGQDLHGGVVGRDVPGLSTPHAAYHPKGGGGGGGLFLRRVELSGLRDIKMGDYGGIRLISKYIVMTKIHERGRRAECGVGVLTLVYST
jgi:hypothetical protein